jgi:hypothetical protein
MQLDETLALHECAGTVTINKACDTSILIETPFTKTRRPFMIELDNRRMMNVILHVYRLINGRETEITTKENKIKQLKEHLNSMKSVLNQMD